VTDVLDRRWQSLNQLLVEQSHGGDGIVVTVNSDNVGVLSAFLACLEEIGTVGNLKLLLISSELSGVCNTHKNLGDGAKLGLLLLL